MDLIIFIQLIDFVIPGSVLYNFNESIACKYFYSNILNGLILFKSVYT